MTKKTRKLSLNKETLRNLSDANLRRVVGGTTIVMSGGDRTDCLCPRIIIPGTDANLNDGGLTKLGICNMPDKSQLCF